MNASEVLCRVALIIVYPPTSRSPTNNYRLLPNLILNNKAFSSTGSEDVNVARPVFCVWNRRGEIKLLVIYQIESEQYSNELKSIIVDIERDRSGTARTIKLL